MALKTETNQKTLIYNKIREKAKLITKDFLLFQQVIQFEKIIILETILRNIQLMIWFEGIKTTLEDVQVIFYFGFVIYLRTPNLILLA